MEPFHYIFVNPDTTPNFSSSAAEGVPGDEKTDVLSSHHLPFPQHQGTEDLDHKPKKISEYKTSHPHTVLINMQHFT